MCGLSGLGFGFRGHLILFFGAGKLRVTLGVCDGFRSGEARLARQLPFGSINNQSQLP